MLVPLTDEEFEELLPPWAQKLARLKQPRCPLVVGLPVYDVLYGPKYGNPRGIVVEYRPCDDACLLRRDHELAGHVLVEFPNGGTSFSLATHWVPDCDTDQGREFVESAMAEKLTTKPEI